MANRPEAQRSYLKFGVLILVAVAAVAILALLLSGKTGELFTSKITVRAYFKNANGLKVGSPVNLDGVNVGNVRAVRIVAEPVATPVEIVMTIHPRFRNEVLTDSRANISNFGVLGDTEVDIDNVGAYGPPIANNGVLLTGGAPNLDDAMRSFQRTTQKISTTVGKMDVFVSHVSSNQGSIGKLINDPALRNRAARAVKEFSSISTRAGEGKGTIGKMMTDDSLTNHVKELDAKLSGVTTEIKSGEGTAGQFMKNPALGRNLKEVSEQLDQTSAAVHSGRGAIAMMLKNPDFKKSVGDVGHQLNSMIAQTSAGKGTVGQIMNNRSLHDHVNDLVANSRKLVTGMRKHPMKYFAIRFRIF